MLDADRPERVVRGIGDEAEERAAVRVQRVDVGGGVRLVVFDIQAERRLPRDDRTADAAADACDVLRRLRGGKRIARVEDVVAEIRIQVAVPRRHVRPRDDLDLHAPRIVVVGRERIRTEADLADVFPVRQPAASEAVDAEHRAGAARHLLQDRLQLVGIVGQLFDDALVEDVHRLRAPRRLNGRRRVLDLHLFLEPLDGERDRLVVGAAAQRDRHVARREADGFDVNLRGGGGQRRNVRDAAVVGRHLHGRRSRRRHRDDRLRNSRARLIEHDNAQLRGRRRGLCQRRHRDAESGESQCGARHCTKVSALKFGLILKLLILSSSCVIPSGPRVIRCGSLMPFTVL